jgi:hypothetical protein
MGQIEVAQYSAQVPRAQLGSSACGFDGLGQFERLNGHRFLSFDW